jgi:hypothetical protein
MDNPTNGEQLDVVVQMTNSQGGWNKVLAYCLPQDGLTLQNMFLRHSEGKWP